MHNDEAKIISGLRRKDPRALEHVIEIYSGGVYALARRILITCNSQDIEECVSDVFVKVWNESAKFDSGRGNLKTWILVISKFTALDYRRRLATKVEQALPDQGIADVNVEEEVIQRETAAQILENVNNFSETDRLIFYRRYVLYDGIENIARQLGLTRNAVDTRLWRIRKTLRVLINGKEGIL